MEQWQNDDNLREQFCVGGMDITSSPYASQDADEVRLWEHDVLIGAFTKNGDDTWELDATDVADMWPAAEGVLWRTPREALTFAREWLASNG